MPVHAVLEAILPSRVALLFCERSWFVSITAAQHALALPTADKVTIVGRVAAAVLLLTPALERTIATDMVPTFKGTK